MKIRDEKKKSEEEVLVSRESLIFHIIETNDMFVHDFDALEMSLLFI